MTREGQRSRDNPFAAPGVTLVDFKRHWFGNYELLRPLGIGGMAEVYLARTAGARGFSKTVVIKRVLPRLRGLQHFEDMFAQEAKRSVLLQHSNIVQTLSFEEENGWPFMVLEFVHGKDLRQVFRTARTMGYDLPVDFTIYCITEVLKGLDHAHNLTQPDGSRLNLVHRDVTPDNIFISFDGAVKLGDFGVAHFVGEVQKGQFRGKFAYCAPEVLEDVDVDARADIFSVGVVLWELLTSRPLFAGGSAGDILLQIRDQEAPPPSTYNPRVAPDLDAIVMKAVQKRRRVRYASALQFEEALSDFLLARRRTWSSRRMAEVMKALFPDEHKPLELPPPEAMPQPLTSPAPVTIDLSDIASAHLSQVGSGAQPGFNRLPPPSRDDFERLRDPIESRVVEVEEHVSLDDFWSDETNPERIPVRMHDSATPLPMDLQSLTDVIALHPYEVESVGSSVGNALPLPEFGARVYWDSLVGFPIPSVEPIFEDSFDNLSVCRLLFELTYQGMSGLILFTNEANGRRRLLSVKEGMPVYVYSDDPYDGVPAMLRRYQLISPSILFRAMHRVLRERVYIDQALVLTLQDAQSPDAQEEVRRAFSALVRLRLFPVFGWRGHFRFFPNVLTSLQYRWRMPALTSILIRAVRRAISLPDLEARLRGRGEHCVVLAEDARSLLPELRFRPEDLAVVAAVDNRRSVPQILQRVGAHSAEQLQRALAVLYVLAETRLAEFI